MSTLEKLTEKVIHLTKQLDKIVPFVAQLKERYKSSQEQIMSLSDQVKELRAEIAELKGKPQKQVKKPLASVSSNAPTATDSDLEDWI